MSQVAEIKGLKELLGKMTAYPMELVKTVAVGMSASLNTFWENVPPYPPPPQDSSYIRTGLLGKSLGSGEGGGASGGGPSIYRIKQLGEGNFEGTFGTSLHYAHHVIGDGDAQAWMHYRWWQMKQIAEKSADKINQIWQSIGDKLAAFLAGKGL